MFSQEYDFETREIDVNGRIFVLSIMHHHVLLTDDPEGLRPKLFMAHHQMAADFHANVHSKDQLSACVIDDTLPISHRVTAEIGEAYFAQITKEDVRTQQYYFQLFGRPVFQIYVVESTDADEFNRRLRQINRSADPVMFAKTVEDAIKQAGDMLRIAHRL